MLVEMALSRILIRELSDVQLIELREVNPRKHKARSLPIVIGLSQAIAIDQRLSGFEHGRPMTHDLLANTIHALDATLESISISHIINGTFFAQLNLINSSGDSVEVDARPSDAIALGLTREVPIYVDDEVIEYASSQYTP